MVRLDVAGPPDVEQLGDAVLLRRPIAAEVRGLLTAAAREAVRRDGVRPSQRLLHLLAVLDAAANVRPDVRTVTSAPPPCTVDAMCTSEAAAALGIGERQTRRLAGPLGARRTATGWLFDRRAVDTAAEGKEVAMTDLLTEAWSAVPGWAEITAGIKAARLAQIRTQPEVNLAQVRADLRQRLLAGQPLNTVVADVSRAQQCEAAAVTAATLLRDIGDELQADLDLLRRDGADLALSRLADELPPILAGVRDLAPALAGIESADAAIAAGGKAVTAWADLQELVGRHVALRRVQATVTAHGYGGAGRIGDAAEAGNARRAVELFGHLRDAGEHIDAANEQARPAWPDDPTGFLRWLAQPGRQPWLPTVTELRAAAAEHRQIVDAEAYDRATARTRPRTEDGQLSTRDRNTIRRDLAARRAAAN